MADKVLDALKLVRQHLVMVTGGDTSQVPQKDQDRIDAVIREAEADHAQYDARDVFKLVRDELEYAARLCDEAEANDFDGGSWGLADKIRARKQSYEDGDA